MKQLITLLICLTTQFLFAQNSNYLMPMRLLPVLSGNFGEIRSGHLHSGLDFKTQGRTGFPVRAMADGYISKIFVSYGSGYMLHVTYNNGYTAIYRHNEGFPPKIARYTRNYQYEHEVDLCEIDVPEGVLPVVRGEIIAKSGNEGYSMGPHLHLDLYETSTGDWVDPLPHLAQSIADHRAPQAKSIFLVEQPGRGIILGRERISNLSAVNESIDCWGEIGVAIDADDYMDGAWNKLGVKYIRLTVDGREVYRSELNRFSRAENRIMYSWLVRGHLKSYIEPGAQLRFIHTDKNRGILHIDEERDYKLQYTLKDEAGNESNYSFVLRGKQTSIPQINYGDARCLKWNQANDLSMPGMQLVLPRGVLTNDEYVNPSMEAASDATSVRYILSGEPLLLAGSCELQIALRRIKGIDNPKYYYIASYEDGKKKYVGGKCKNGFITASIDRLSTYFLEVDTVAPVITPVGSPKTWEKQGVITFSIQDGQTSVMSYKGKIDGRFELFHLRRRTGRITCNLNECKLTRGTTHTLEMVATDACGNASVYRTTFIW